MGKGDRKKKQLLPKLAQTPRKKSRGAARMREIERERDEANVVLMARARQCGGKAEDMKGQMLGDDAGKAIHMICGDDAPKVYEAYNGCRTAHERYHKQVMGTSLYAKVAKIETMPERFETRPDDQPDLRTEDERHRDAVNSYQVWVDRLNSLPLAQSAHIHSAINSWTTLLDAGAVTAKGREFVAAAIALAEICEKSRK